jgi:hypothetical protein
MRAFRNSQLALRRECPHAYRRAYVDGDEGVPSPSLRAGQNVHAAIALAIRSIVTHGMLDVHRVAHETVRGGDVEYSDALEVLTLFQEQLGVEWDIDPAGTVFVEERLTMPLTLRSGEQVEFRGTPDLVERSGRGRFRITDFKTHWHPETEHAFRAGQQLKRYALLLQHAYPAATEFELVKRFVRYTHSAFRETLLSDQLSWVRERLISEIEETIDFELAGEFQPTPGSWCGLCRAHASCPIILRYRERGLPDDLSIEDDERARQLAGDAHALDSARKALQDSVKRYLGAEHRTGRVPLAGGEYGYGPVNHREVDCAELRRVFLEHGLEPDDRLFRVDLEQLDRAKRRWSEDLVKAIDSITRSWQTSDCRFRKTTMPAPPTEALV